VIRDICGSQNGDHEYCWILKYKEFRRLHFAMNAVRSSTWLRTRHKLDRFWHPVPMFITLCAVLYPYALGKLKFCYSVVDCRPTFNNLTFVVPCIVNVFLQVLPTRSNVIQYYLLLSMLYMFRAVSPPIIRSSRTVHTASCMCQACLLLPLAWVSWKSCTALTIIKNIV